MTTQTRTYAAIDIGSNAARLLIKEITFDETSLADTFTKKLLLRIPLRLGFDVFGNGRISDTKAEQLYRLMKAYKQLMKIYNVEKYRACATSAMRDADNGKALLKKIKKGTGIDIEIINGEEEALMVYNNHFEYLEDRRGNYMYVDVGGGSTEVNLLVNGELVYSQSFNIGTVRILTGGVTEAAWMHMRETIAAHTKDYPNIHIIGSGGNINRIFRMATKSGKNQKRITVHALQNLYQQLQPLSVENRMQQFGLKADRADVIVPASQIFMHIADTIHAEYIYVPGIGLADGIISNLYALDKIRAQAAPSRP